MEDSASPERLKFYGPRDLANDWAAAPAVALVREYAASRLIRSMNDALELHNALACEEHGILPDALAEQNRAELASSAREARRRIAAFFLGLEASNLEDQLTGFDYQYAEDLLVLLDRHNVAERVEGQVLFDALVKAGMPMSVMLGDRRFVDRHDHRLREALLADARNGELVVSSRMIKDSSASYALPKSFSGADAQQLLSAYIESESPHPNYVEAIAHAKDDEGLGVTPKIRLQAKKRYDALMRELFSEGMNTLVRNNYGVSINSEQREPVREHIEHGEGGFTHMRSFGERYLMGSLSPEKVLKNFASVVGYLDRYGLLTMPSFSAQIGAIQRLFVSGKHFYPKGQVFKRLDALTRLGTQAYSDFLRRNGVEVEEVVSWFFREHLADQFGAANFYYTPSSPSSSFLERCRHVCAEMESVVRQFTLYCDEGELDPDLLRMTSAPRPSSQIPSLVDRKYLHRAEASDCDQALHLLFNDQSRIAYINPTLKARNFVELVAENQVLYSDLLHHQTQAIDWLISEGLVAVDDEDVIHFASPTLVLVLSDINGREAAPYGNYGDDERIAAQALVDKGWLKFTSTLLTSAEASYFNYLLNKSEFSDGLDLRNKYSHGTNADPKDHDAHRQSYVQLIRLLVALILKIQDDFQMSAAICGSATPSR